MVTGRAMKGHSTLSERIHANLTHSHMPSDQGFCALVLQIPS